MQHFKLLSNEPIVDTVAHSEVSDYVNYVGVRDAAIPLIHQIRIHINHFLEWSITVFDDVFVTKMKVTRYEYLFHVYLAHVRHHVVF